MRQLEVYVNEIKAGLLTEQNPGKGYTFAYSAEYVASDYPPVSLSLPKRTEAYEADRLAPAYVTIPFLFPVKELLVYFSLHNDAFSTFLRFLPYHILHLFEIFCAANIHLFEIFPKFFCRKR